MRFKKTDNAVSEVVGSVVLLAIAVVFVSAIYVNILSDEGPIDRPFVTITGRAQDEYVYITNQMGESLSTDTIVSLKIAGAY